MSNCVIPQYIQGSLIPLIFTHKDRLGNARDLSGAVLSNSKIMFIDSDGTATEREPAFTNSGSDGKLEYAVQASDTFLTVGTWKVYTIVSFSASNIQISKTGEFEVVAAGDI